MDRGYYDVDEFVDADDYDFDETADSVRDVKKEEPMFKLERASRPGPVDQVIVQNGMVVMAMQSGQILRLNTSAGQETPETIRLSSAGGSRRGKHDGSSSSSSGPVRLHKVFLDPNGIHLIISTKARDNYYISQSMSAPRQLKLRGCIDSVAWDAQNISDTSTNSILVGTGGRIVEMHIDGGKEKVSRVVFDVHDEATKFTGLRFERFPPSPTEPTKYFVMATTPTRLYEFVGGPTFEAMFAASAETHQFKEVYGEFDRSELVFWSKHGGLPTHFAWMTGQGLYHGTLIFGSQVAGEPVHRASPLIPWGPAAPAAASAAAKSVRGASGGVGAEEHVPVAIGMTEFHYLVLYPHTFQTISRISPDEESSTACPPSIEMVGITHDPSKDVTYVYSRDTVFLLVIKEEDRNVWELWLEQEEYSRAVEHAKTPAQRDVVLRAQADNLLRRGQPLLAAEHYGRTNKSFEEVVMAFVRMGRRDALRTYLLTRLGTLRLKEATQKTLICTWLVELMLCGMDDAEGAGDRSALEAERGALRSLLKEYREHVDASTTFTLLSSHGRTSEMLFYANLRGEHDRVMTFFIREGMHEQAIRMMVGQSDVELFYKFSPTLLCHAPHLTVQAWAQARVPLDERRLIPALMRYTPHACNAPGDTEHYAIKWLEHSVSRGNVDPTIHNYLLSLYAHQEDERKLLALLGAAPRHFDLRFALRQCIKHKRWRGQVQVYGMLDLHEEAVALALAQGGDDALELAKRLADAPAQDEGLRRRLWLRVARHVVEQHHDIKAATRLLKECPLLKVEDILPFFPTFNTIDDFKAEICNSLTDYNRHIDQLVGEMDDATESADLIRLDIRDLTNRYGEVRESAVCALCRYPALARPYYMFPCTHAFHCDCLVEEASRVMSAGERARLNELQELIRGEEQRRGGDIIAEKYEMSDLDNDEAGMIGLRREEQLKLSLDDLVASECPYCGERMISSLGMPFILADQDATEVKEWYI